LHSSFCFCCTILIHIGGEDFDENVMEFLLDKFFAKHEEIIIAEAIKSGIPKEEAIQVLYKNEILIRRLRSSCEMAKKELSFKDVYHIKLDNFYQSLEFDEEVTRFQFEELNKKLFLSTLLPVENVLREAKIDKSNVSEIVFIGGSTRIPYIQTLLDDFFPTQIKSRSINVDEAVAYGATIRLFDYPTLHLHVYTQACLCFILHLCAVFLY
jgi:L1 cell adhesion molecule like protein